MAPKIRVPKANWLLVLWRRAADVLMQDSGDQALIEQIFLGSSPLQHFKVGRVFATLQFGRSADVRGSLSNGWGVTVSTGLDQW